MPLTEAEQQRIAEIQWHIEKFGVVSWLQWSDSNASILWLLALVQRLTQVGSKLDQS